MIGHLKSLLAAIIVAGITSASSANPTDLPRQAAAVLPYADEDTVVVVHVAMGRLDVDRSFQEIRDLLDLPEEIQDQIEVPKIHAKRLIDAMLKAGVEDLFLVVNLSQLIVPGPFLLMTVREGANPDTAIGLLGTLRRGRPFETMQRLDRIVYAGPRRTLERLTARKPAARPHLTEAMAASDGAALTVLLLPTDDHRRVLREMIPELPERFGGGGGKEIADGLQWAVVSLQLSPHPAVKITLQAKDPQAASAFRQTISAAFKWLGQNDAVRTMLPDIDELAIVVTPAVDGDRLLLKWSQQDQSLQTIAGGIRPLLLRAGALAQANASSNNLKQLALAMHNYHDTYKHLPASASYDQDGNPLLSWRVHLLPYLEANALYQQFHLDEPWDSPHNRQLIGQMPAVFGSSSHPALRTEGKTRYLAPLGQGTIMEGNDGLSIRDIPDGTSSTIMLVEVAPENAVIWTKPDDWRVDWEHPLRGLAVTGQASVLVVYCDASVQTLPLQIDAEKLRRLLQRNDGKPVR